MKFLQQGLTRKLLSAIILCVAVALLTSHFSFQQVPQLIEGDIAAQDIEATIEFDYIDEMAWTARKQEVALEQPAIYDLDVSKQITLEHRINVAFESARQRLDEISSVGNDEAGEQVLAPDMTDLEKIQVEFEDALGLALRADERLQFIETQWSLELQQVSLRLLQDSMQFYIIDVASEIPTTGQIFEVQRQFEREEDTVRLSDARNVKTRREVQQYVSVLAANLSTYTESLRRWDRLLLGRPSKLTFHTTMQKPSRCAWPNPKTPLPLFVVSTEGNRSFVKETVLIRLRPLC